MIRSFHRILHASTGYIPRALTVGYLVVAGVFSFALTRNTQITASEFTPLQRDAVEIRIDSLLQVMTIDEKVGQLVQYSGGWEDGNDSVRERRKGMVRKGEVGSFLNVTGAALTRDIQRIALEESRLKIPLLFGLDVIHGFRTTFPIPLALASSWDSVAVEKASQVAAREASSSGIHWTFAPMVDIGRDPRWGRIAEGAGEDPFLGSVMARAQVRGFQGKSLGDPATVVACPKHFAAYGAPEGGKDYNTVDLSERTLREIYLPPFKAAVDAGAGTIMCSFNEISGTPSSANRWLLTDVLRREWNFDGFVVSDWNSVGELLNHRLVAAGEEAAALGISAGCDMDMESNLYRNHLPTLVQQSKVSEGTLNEAVRRILRIKFRLGLFDDPYKYCSPEREQKTILTFENLEVARDVARKSIVLLKNDNDVLPMTNAKSIAVIGPLADDHQNSLGPWSAMGRQEDVVSVLDGLKNQAGKDTRIVYAKGCEIGGTNTDQFDEAVSVAKQADVVVLVMGEAAAMSGEAASRSSLNLPGVQHQLVKAVHAAGKPTVLIVMSGRPLSVAWEAENIPAIVQAWFLGIQSGNALADVILGKTNPSGKLPVSIPRTVGQVPIYYNHKSTGRPGDLSNKYSSKYIDLPLTPLFAFGHGLSYTTFQYSNMTLSDEKIANTENITASITVTNTGKRDGDEVVQLYLRDDIATVTRPVMELRNFQKIHLAAGESKQVKFEITPNDLSFYDKNMRWTLEPGSFTLFIGGSSDRTIQATFEVIASDHSKK